MSSIHPYSNQSDQPVSLKTDTLTICTQIKDYGSSPLSCHGLFDQLTLNDYVGTISPLPLQRQCPSPPRPMKYPVFCWSQISECSF